MDIQQSLHRILNSQTDFGGLFYETFLRQSPDARRFFEDVDMRRQAVLLTMALSVIVQFYKNPYPATEKYLRYLGSKHSDRHVPEAMYGEWTSSMLDTLKGFHGDDWSAELESQWREAIGCTAERLLEGYEGHFAV